MLQQTRVEAAIPFYEKFLSSFPTPKALAKADIDDVLKHWAGLGYYSRARNIKKAAEILMNDYKGAFPKTAEGLRVLPGIGPYTSAAIASIAFGESIIALDGNLERVISRLLALDSDPKTKGRAQIESYGAALVQYGTAGDLNQAMMDLASSICLPKNPKCLVCPISNHCVAYQTCDPSRFPIKKAKPIKKEITATGVILFQDGRVLLAKRKKGSWLAGLWDIPWWSEGADTGGKCLKLGKSFSETSVNRVITNHKIRFQVKGIEIAKQIPGELLALISQENEIHEWFELAELEKFRFPNSTKKAMNTIFADFDRNKNH